MEGECKAQALSMSFSCSKEDALSQKHPQDNDLCTYLTLKLGKQGRDPVTYSHPLKAILKECLKPNTV